MNDPAPEIVVCADLETCVERAARRIVSAASTAIGARGRFAIALAGGSTPEPLYESLGDSPGRDALDWSRVEVFWGDERCVPPDHPDSNYRMARAALLDAVPIPPERIHRIRGEEPDPEYAADLYERELHRELSSSPRDTPRLDLVLLGLGTDGHTASLFPESEALEEKDRLVAAVKASTPTLQPPVVERVTLTPPAINAADEVLFLVAGEEKAPAVEAVLEGPREPRRWPAQAIDPGPGRLAWLVDAGAARSLSDLHAPEGREP
ncbi:MAG: 6-phosphogluconolactonase [Gemmatimonadota bacterium]|nr:6-phosphogluconolactonase [Gemmatimonadota bacterium]